MQVQQRLKVNLLLGVAEQILNYVLVNKVLLIVLPPVARVQVDLMETVQVILLGNDKKVVGFCNEALTDFIGRSGQYYPVNDVVVVRVQEDNSI